MPPVFQQEAGYKNAQDNTRYDEKNRISGATPKIGNQTSKCPLGITNAEALKVIYPYRTAQPNSICSPKLNCKDLFGMYMSIITSAPAGVRMSETNEKRLANSMQESKSTLTLTCALPSLTDDA